MSILSTRRSALRAAGHASSSLRARASLAHLLLTLAAACSIALLAMPAVAGETGTLDDSAAGLGPSAYGYKPSIMGLSRYRARAAKAGLPSPTQAAPCPQCEPQAPFTPQTFRNSMVIDNTWMPLKPGSQLVLRGVWNRDGGLRDHLVIFTVTDLVKVINGIECVVVWDRDISEGVLAESELAFFAQHDNGGVYNSGEYPEVYEQGQFLHAEDTWIHGVEGARAGVHVWGRPVVGVGYEEAMALENDFWDCGKVDVINSGRTEADPPLCVPGGCFGELMTVREWAPLDGCSVIQLKTYAKGVGIIKVGAIDDPEGETLVMETFRTLSPQELDAASASAMALDRHGPQVNENYTHTTPAFRRGILRKAEGRDAPPIVQDVSKLITGPTFLYASRNPVSGPTTLSYGITVESVADLAIYDVVGRRIRSIVSEPQTAGAHTAVWDGRDDSGEAVVRGVYFARLRAGATSLQRTLVVTR